MLKALIVDDEKLIRLGMRRAIPWEKLGIGEVFAAKSGGEALGIIRQHAPEIMITDIKMDGMSGLELIDQAAVIAPDMRVLVLTGYDDFEYAQRCIRLQVVDFFLKPIDERTLMEAVRKQVDAITASRLDRLEEDRMSRARAVAEQMQIDRLLRDVVAGRKPERAVEALCAQFGFARDQPLRAAILASAGEPDDYANATIKRICIDMVDAQNRGVSFQDDAGRVVVSLFLDATQDSALEYLGELGSILSDEFGQPPRMAIGNPAQLCALFESYRDAAQLLEQEVGDSGFIIQTPFARSREDDFRAAFAQIRDAMGGCGADASGVLALFSKFCKIAIESSLSDAAMGRCCFELASTLYCAFMSHTGFMAGDELPQLLNALQAARADERLTLTQAFITRLLEGREDPKQHEMVDRAKRYIVEHLAEELSVSEIAAKLYISPNHLSRLFKRVTGEGCYEYVVRKRIERAKQLLETTCYKPAQIAEMVGYNDTNYFSLALKKNTGMSPQNYRKQFTP